MVQTAVAHKPETAYPPDCRLGHEWVVRPDGQVLLILSSSREDTVVGARLSYRIDDVSARFDGVCLRFEDSCELYLPFDGDTFSIRHRLASSLRLQGQLLIVHCDLGQPDQGMQVKQIRLDPTSVSRRLS